MFTRDSSYLELLKGHLYENYTPFLKSEILFHANHHTQYHNTLEMWDKPGQEGSCTCRVQRRPSHAENRATTTAHFVGWL